MLMRRIQAGLLFVLLSLVVFLPAGCGSREKKDYARPLPPGQHALRKITNPEDLPDLEAAWRSVDESLARALDNSIEWIASPNRESRFPVSGISWEKARDSVKKFRSIVKSSFSAVEFKKNVLQYFDVYTSVGCDDKGTVLYTGYFSPVFEASWEKTDSFAYPLYKKPDDLMVDWKTRKVLGQKKGDKVAPYPVRREIEESNMLAGGELVWLADPLSVYLIHVNGSAKLRMQDGATVYVGYAGNNGRPYTSIGKLLVEDKRIRADAVSYFTIQDFFRRHPDRLSFYTYRNDRYIFFKLYSSEDWPTGSLGFKVTTFRTLATDKSVFPPGCVTMASTRIPDETGRRREFQRIMVDQDTGGAIRAAGRADIYMGTGRQAKKIAGLQREEGRLYYFFLKE